jgi:biopolymer transport protein ExbB/TolQ
LLLFILYSAYSVGSVLVELIVERRHYRAVIPELVAKIDEAKPEDLHDTIDKSAILRTQKDDLQELVAYMYLPEDARTEVAKRLLANESAAFQKLLGKTDVATKVAPMLGLMGTLIPLGPGIVALGEGNVDVLSAALLVAFDTTVAGLATAVVCFVVSWIRRRWYSDYLISMEALFNTLLEKATNLHREGHQFEVAVYHYDKMGRTAYKVSKNSTADAVSRTIVENAVDKEAEKAGKKAGKKVGKSPWGKRRKNVN